MAYKKKIPKLSSLSLWKTLLIWFFIIIAIMLLTKNLNKSEKAVGISYTDFYNELLNDNVSEVVFIGNSLEGKLKNEAKVFQKGKAVVFLKYKTEIPIRDPDLVKILVEKNVKVTVKNPINWWDMIWPYIPFIIIIMVWIFIMRRMQGSAGKAFDFGKSKAKMVYEGKEKVTFKDVAGAEEAKQELEEVIDFLKKPRKFQKLGAKIPKGVLLLGAPGTGKTLLARAVAGEAQVPFLTISGSDFVEMFVGVGASRVRDLFNKSKQIAPCIVFIDEIDAVGRHRGAGLGGGNDEREQTLNALLVEMDGFEINSGVIVIAATNRPDVLDPALLRPGRFDRQVVVDLPDLIGREAILRVHTRKTLLAEDVNLMNIARGTPGFSGADIANIVNEAALRAAKLNKNKIGMSDFLYAKDKIIMGVERKSMVIRDEDKKLTAYHEAGHTLVSKLTPGMDPIEKVTIIPRGRALGVTMHLPIDDRRNYDLQFLKGELAILMGGRVAEEIVFKNITTGAANDIQKATELARKMVCEWGMSKKLGNIAYNPTSEHIFIGRELAKHKVFSEETSILIDKEVFALINEGYNKAKKILEDNRKILDKIVETLIERETIMGAEIDKIIKKYKKDYKPTKYIVNYKKKAEKTVQEKIDEVLKASDDGKENEKA
jgi:cell division protease FtsH